MTLRLLTATVLAASLAGCGMGEDTKAVPDLTGKSVNAARAAADRDGFQLSVEQGGNGATRRAFVCSQKPKAGLKLDPAIDPDITVVARRRC